jgi:CRP/FNR family cyclic AMP-dependent transcriptional regulator
MLPQTVNSPNVEKLLAYSQRRRFGANSHIQCVDERRETLSFIIKGSVTLFIEDEDGREMIIAYLNPGDYFGELGLFATAHQSAGNSPWLRARTECEVADISYQRFRELARRNPVILFDLGKQIAQRLRRTTRKVGDLAFVDVSGRIVSCLLDLCKQPEAMTHPDGMQIRITRLEIGRIVGCSRQMVGQVLKELEERSLVHVRGKTMVIYGTR